MGFLLSEHFLRRLSVFALGILLLNALLACTWLAQLLLVGKWQLFLLHLGKCLLVTGWVGYRWISLARRRYLVKRPWQAGRPQQLKYLFLALASLAALIWLLLTLFVTGVPGLLAQGGFAWWQVSCLSVILLGFVGIDIVNFMVLEKVVIDTGETDVSGFTY